MERLSERLTSVEAILKKLDPIESLLERIALLEKYIYHQTGVYLPRGLYVYRNIREYAVQANIRQGDSALQATWQMIYFAKEDLDEWLLQNYEPTVDEAARMANEAAATQPFFNQRRHGKRKKN